MVSYYGKYEYINDDRIPDSMIEYLNKYCKSHQDATGTSCVDVKTNV